MKLDFTKMKVYGDVTKKESSVRDLRIGYADIIFKRGMGVEDHALMHKVLDCTGETEFTAGEVERLKEFFNTYCTPAFIDVFNEHLQEMNQ